MRPKSVEASASRARTSRPCAQATPPSTTSKPATARACPTAAWSARRQSALSRSASASAPRRADPSRPTPGPLWAATRAYGVAATGSGRGLPRGRGRETPRGQGQNGGHHQQVVAPAQQRNGVGQQVHWADGVGEGQQRHQPGTGGNAPVSQRQQQGQPALPEQPHVPNHVSVYGERSGSVPSARLMGGPGRKARLALEGTSESSSPRGSGRVPRGHARDRSGHITENTPPQGRCDDLTRSGASPPGSGRWRLVPVPDLC